MRILVLTDFLSDAGGTEYHTTLLARGLKRAGHEVMVFVGESLRSNVWTSILRQADVPYFSAEQPPSDHEPHSRSRHALVGAISRCIDEFRPEIVHTNPIGPACYSAIRATPKCGYFLVGTEASSASSSCPWYTHEVFEHVNSLDCVVATCDRVAHGVRSYFRYEGRVEVIPYFIERPTQAAEAFNREYYDEPTIGFIGRLSLEKGMPFLLSSLAVLRQQHPGARLLLFGSGDEAEVRFLSKALGVWEAITLAGGFTPLDIDRVAAQCDVFVLPSLFEGLPISILELAARGKPVAAFDVGGLQELLSNSPNATVPVGRCELLADSIHQMIENGWSAEYASFAERIRSEYSEESIIPRLVTLYRSLLAC